MLEHRSWRVIIGKDNSPAQGAMDLSVILIIFSPEIRTLKIDGVVSLLDNLGI